MNDQLPNKAKFIPDDDAEEMDVSGNSVEVCTGKTEEGITVILIKMRRKSGNYFEFMLSKNASCALWTLLGNAIAKLKK